MRQVLSIVMAGILGGLVAYGAFTYQLDRQFQLSNAERSESSLAKNVNYNVGPSSGSLPNDFVMASEKATAAVVHIYAEEDPYLAAQRNQQQSRRNFPRFFDDFFGDGFFGQNFYQPKRGTGSGVILSEDGYIVSNNHVVGFADFIEVTLADGRKVEAKKIGTDPSTDLAVLKIEADDLHTITYGDSDKVRVGEWVLAVGNPFDLTSTVTAGIVSAKGRDINIIKADKSIEEFIQTDAAVNPGNSGGALVDHNGYLIGINTAIATPTGVYAGYSFAIPSNLVKRIVKDIIENGSIERTNLGVVVLDVDEKVSEQLHLSVNRGVYVDEVMRRSAAHYAGVVPGDVIVGIDDTDIKSYDDIVEAMKYAKVGDEMQLKIVRNGKKEILPVRLRKTR